MKNRHISAAILFFLGFFIIYSGQLSIAPGMSIRLGYEKYIIGFILIAISICEIICFERKIE